MLKSLGKILYSLFIILEALLAVRFVLKLFGLGSGTFFEKIVLIITNPALTPLQKLPVQSFYIGTFYVETIVLVALIFYIVIIFILIEIVRGFFS